MRALSSQACSDRTGQLWSAEPYGMPIRRERPSWSVLGPLQGDCQPGARELDVGHVEGDQLGAAEGAGESQQQ
jgi:hypothetical protein